jgi:hypothetical protein
MKMAIIQSYFFPYIGYFQLIDSVDKFILYGRVFIVKKSWITLNRILEKGKGVPVHINVPIIGKNSSKLIKANLNYTNEFKRVCREIYY